MPVRSRRFKPRSVLRKRRVLRPRRFRVTRAPRAFSGHLAITRTANVCNAGGFAIDGVLSTSSGNSHLIITTPSTANTFSYGAFSYYVALQDLPNYTEFTNLYDQYKIVGVKFRIVPFSVSPATGGAVTSTAAQPSCMFHMVVDNDDASKPTASEAGISELRQCPGYRSVNPYLYQRKGITRYFKPRVATAAYNGAFAGYKSDTFGWCDCGNPGIQGYGLKGVVETISGGAANLLWFKVEAKVYLVFRHPR